MDRAPVRNAETGARLILPPMNRTSRAACLAAAVIVLATGCKSDNAPATTPPPVAAAQPFKPFVVTDSANVRQIAPGVTAYIIELGAGETAKPGQEVLVNYHGAFPNGKAFDSSMDPAFGHQQPLPFLLGQGQVIEGWDIAMAAMPVGSKFKLVLAPEVAYKERGTGCTPDGNCVIPPNSTLHFDIHILGANTPAARPSIQ